MRTLTITNSLLADLAAETIAKYQVYDFNMDQTGPCTWRLYDMQIADYYSWEDIYDSDYALQLFEENLSEDLQLAGLTRKDFYFSGSIN